MTTKEAMDSGVSRRRASAPKAGSVCETRMKLDEVKGGIEVFNANHQNPEENDQIVCTSTSDTANPVNDKEAIGTVDKVVGAKQGPVRGGSATAKRKTWKSDGLEGSPIQIGRQRSEVSKNLDDKFKESSDSADGSVKKRPVQTKKTRSVSVLSRKMKSDSAEEAKDGNSGPGKVEIEDLMRNQQHPIGEKSRSEEELGVCEVKEESSNADNINNTDEEEEEENHKKIEVEIAEKDLLMGNQKYLPNPPIVKKQLPLAADHVKFLQKNQPKQFSCFLWNFSFIYISFYCCDPLKFLFLHLSSSRFR